MTATLTALANALGPWPLAFVLLGAVVVVSGAIILRSKIALDISRDSKNKWRVRFVRIEEGGQIGDLPVYSKPESAESRRKPTVPDRANKSQ